MPRDAKRTPASPAKQRQQSYHGFAPVPGVCSGALARLQLWYKALVRRSKKYGVVYTWKFGFRRFNLSTNFDLLWIHGPWRFGAAKAPDTKEQRVQRNHRPCRVIECQSLLSARPHGRDQPDEPVACERFLAVFVARMRNAPAASLVLHM